MPGIISVESMAAKTKPLPGKLQPGEGEAGQRAEEELRYVTDARQDQAVQDPAREVGVTVAVRQHVPDVRRSSGSRHWSARRSAARPALRTCS